MMQIAMMFGFMSSYPVNWWLIRRGVKEAMRTAQVARMTEGLAAYESFCEVSAERPDHSGVETGRRGGDVCNV